MFVPSDGSNTVSLMSVCMSVCMSVYKDLLNGRSSDGKIWHKCSLTIQKINQAGVLEIDQPFGLSGPKYAGRWKKQKSP